MGRVAAGWLLIVLGLTGIVGGTGAVYILSQGDPAAEDAGAQGRRNPGGMPAAPPRKPDPVKRYGPAALAVVAGLVLTCWGLGMRGSGPRARKEGSNAAGKQVCPGCGERSPATAVRCYHCGRAF
jgi:hypothetical protein